MQGFYRTVYYLIQGDQALHTHYPISTLHTAGAIALAIFGITDPVVNLVHLYHEGSHEKKLGGEPVGSFVGGVRQAGSSKKSSGVVSVDLHPVGFAVAVQMVRRESLPAGSTQAVDISGS